MVGGPLERVLASLVAVHRHRRLPLAALSQLHRGRADSHGGVLAAVLLLRRQHEGVGGELVDRHLREAAASAAEEGKEEAWRPSMAQAVVG